MLPDLLPTRAAAELLLHKENTAWFIPNSHCATKMGNHIKLTDVKQIVNAFPAVTLHSSVHKLQAQIPNKLF